ncbi:MAG TPA: DEAD/DEAH box helicase [Polyangiales bacterium]|nr:DEAD/DEAH box helicase [Polyangiales bacterium]
MAELAGDVLRYWLASVRLEESLKVRPRARRQGPGSVVPRVDQPSAGQVYFKLPQADVTRVVLEDEALERGFDAELAAYFEGWLLQQYRRGPDDSELAHVLSFPVVHLPRGELAGLLRRGVKLRFGREDGNFRVPTRTDRKRGDLPPPPDRVTVSCAPRGDESWPFFIDTRLLSYPLGVSSDAIDALFEALRTRGSLRERELITMLADTLEGELGERFDGEPFARLLRAMQGLLQRSPMRANVYPVGIVLDGTQAKTTWYLQRELASLGGEELDGPLHAYLTGKALPAAEAAQRALFTGPALTAHQRIVAERFWGSPLTAVQGPPGTGKTTLILHLCAEHLVRQVDALLDRRTMGAELLVIASGNNRAVDNVIDPLACERALPLALRVGSRQVCEQRLAAQLRAAAVWLAQAKAEPDGVRSSALARTLGAYAALRDNLDRELAPRRDALARNAERSRSISALAALPAASSKVDAELARTLQAPLRKVVKRLSALSELCSAKPTMAHVNAVARHYEKTAARDLPPLEQAMREAGMPLDVPLPPLEAPLDVGALMELWEDGAETLLGHLSELQRELTRAVDDEHSAAARGALAQKLAALGAEEPVPAAELDEATSRALFALALDVREAWARVHADALYDAVEAAARCVEQERSLRPMFRDAAREATLLCQLFGVWGSTLLSLGNCLPADVQVRTIVDEAGQCHPAHAVSALMRADSALLIGDVHQLPPVIELGADDDLRLLRSLRPKVDLEMLAPYRVHSTSDVSAQSLADRAAERLTLIDHFRCQPEIIRVSDALCHYGLRLHAPAVDPASRASLLARAMLMRDLRGEQQRFAGSLHNELELRETVQLVSLLLARGVAPADLAVITPYRGQLDRLRRALLDHGVPLEQSAEPDDEPSPGARSGLALGTVHRFQGGERSIVLFSSVITEPRSLGFLNDRPNLLNVAISRAQQHFICLGHREVLRRGPMTRLLVDATTPA